MKKKYNKKSIIIRAIIKYLLAITEIIFIVVTLSYQMWWLTLAFASLILLHRLVEYKIVEIRRGKTIYLFWFAVIFSLPIFVRIFFFEIYAISSSSMENTLIPGDKILVSKIKYGPRMPQSPFEIPLFNLFFLLSDNARIRINENWWGYCRLQGTNTIERDDVVVFNHIDNPKNLFVKRCIGIPGDTIVINDSEVYINKQGLVIPRYAKFNYYVWYNDLEFLVNILDSIAINYSRSFSKVKEKILEVNMTNDQSVLLGKTASVDSIHIVTTQRDSVPKAFPWDKDFLWTYEDFGPLVIPHKGMILNLNKSNISLYKKVLEKYENDSVCIKKIEKVIADQGSLDYRFKQNYYFVMGDNRHNSDDSREWGLLPENHIIGNVALVLYCSNILNESTDRFLKKVE